MKALAEMFVEAGCANVRTYIQSGNVIFSAPASVLKRLPELITATIRARFSYQIPVIVRTSEQMVQIIRDNPFFRAAECDKTLHVYFLADLPNASAVRKLDPDRSSPDIFCVRNREIYLHLPNGMGRTKLTNAYFDSNLSTTGTGRNWATVLKLNEMMQT